MSAAVAEPADLIVYGLGATGQRVVDHLLSQGRPVVAIADANKAGQTYRGLPILSIDDLSRRPLQQTDCILGLHNHYVDLAAVDGTLRRLGFRSVVGLPALWRHCDVTGFDAGYWLNFAFRAADHAAELAAVRALLADETSRMVLDSIVQFRRSGDVAECPVPSIADEYVPADLPRYRTPVRLVDCGAYDGAAIRKFHDAGYHLGGLIAFEPDPKNYAALVAGLGPVESAILLPMAVWSSNTQLRFSSSGSMASALSQSGDIVIPCGRFDDLARGFAPTVIKMDVEGAEIEALKGMERTIRNHRPDLCLSVYHTPQHLYEIPLLVASWDLGYTFHLRVHEHNTFGTVLYARQPDAASGH